MNAIVQHLEPEILPGPVTVNQILDRYERDVLPHELAPRTQKDYARHIVRLRQLWGDRIAAELKPRDFGTFLAFVGRGRIHRVRALAVLSAAFTHAVSSWFWIDHNVLRDVKRPKAKPRDRLVLDEEFWAIHRVSSPRVQLAMELALHTGQRQGDLLALEWSQIQGMELHCEQSKTGKRLAIEISPDLEKVLDRCWQLKNRDRYVLCRRDGNRYTSEGFRAMWQRAMRRAVKRGVIEKSFTFHDLRALAATKCKTPEIAMRLLGHSNISMTLRVYRRGIERVQSLQLT